MTPIHRWSRMIPGWVLAGAGIGVAAGLVVMAGAMKSPVFGLGGVVAIVGLLAVVRYPGLGMGVLTFLIPLERMQRITNDDASFTISLMRLIAVACLGSLVLQRIHQRRPLRIDVTMLFYGIYVALGIIGIGYTTDPSGTKRFLGTILANCLFIFLYYNYFENRKQIHLTIAIWLAANVVGCLYTAYDWHLGSGAAGAQRLNDPSKGGQTTSQRWSTVWEDITEWDALSGAGTRRSMGPTSHPSVYGINLVTTLPVVFYLLRRYRRFWQQAGLFAMLGLLLYNILLTNTRATFLATAATLVLCVVSGLFKLRRHHLLFVVAGVAALASAVPKDTLMRMLDPRNYTTEHSATLSIRLKYWDASVRILQDHFLLGQGVGNERVVPSYLEGEEVGMQSVHNIFLQIAIETGVLGWLGFFTFVGLMFHHAHAAARTLRGREGWENEAVLLVAIQVVMTAVLLYGLQADVFNFPLKSWWLLATISLVLYRWSRRLPRPADAGERPTAMAWQPQPAR